MKLNSSLTTWTHQVKIFYPPPPCKKKSQGREVRDRDKEHKKDLLQRRIDQVDEHKAKLASLVASFGKVSTPNEYRLPTIMDPKPVRRKKDADTPKDTLSPEMSAILLYLLRDIATKNKNLMLLRILFQLAAGSKRSTVLKDLGIEDLGKDAIADFFDKNPSLNSPTINVCISNEYRQDYREKVIPNVNKESIAPFTTARKKLLNAETNKGFML